MKSDRFSHITISFSDREKGDYSVNAIKLIFKTIASVIIVLLFFASLFAVIASFKEEGEYKSLSQRVQFCEYDYTEHYFHSLESTLTYSNCSEADFDKYKEIVEVYKHYYNLKALYTCDDGNLTKEAAIRRKDEYNFLVQSLEKLKFQSNISIVQKWISEFEIDKI